MPHGLTIDHEDNIWLTDVAMHQIFKVPKGGENPSLILGKEMTPGNGPYQFCQPTDVAVAKNGDFFVADGYCNNRIVKFDSAGKYLESFGTKAPQSNQLSVAPLYNHLDIPHSVALFEDWNTLCIADRENQRIVCISAGLRPQERELSFGNFVAKAENLGRVYAIRGFGNVLVGVTNMDLPFYDEPSRLFMVNLENRTPLALDVKLNNPHALAVSKDGEIDVGENNPSRILTVVSS